MTHNHPSCQSRIFTYRSLWDLQLGSRFACRWETLKWCQWSYRRTLLTLRHNMLWRVWCFLQQFHVILKFLWVIEEDFIYIPQTRYVFKHSHILHWYCFRKRLPRSRKYNMIYKTTSRYGKLLNVRMINRWRWWNKETFWTKKDR